MPKLPCKYQLGTILYLRMGDGSQRGIVTAVTFFADGVVLYRVAWANENRDHCEIELTTAKPSPFEDHTH